MAWKLSPYEIRDKLHQKYPMIGKRSWDTSTPWLYMVEGWEGEEMKHRRRWQIQVGHLQEELQKKKKALGDRL